MINCCTKPHCSYGPLNERELRVSRFLYLRSVGSRLSDPRLAGLRVLRRESPMSFSEIALSDLFTSEIACGVADQRHLRHCLYRRLQASLVGERGHSRQCSDRAGLCYWHDHRPRGSRRNRRSSSHPLRGHGQKTQRHQVSCDPGEPDSSIVKTLVILEDLSAKYFTHCEWMLTLNGRRNTVRKEARVFVGIILFGANNLSRVAVVIFMQRMVC